jgi:hypothetical protein
VFQQRRRLGQTLPVQQVSRSSVFFFAPRIAIRLVPMAISRLISVLVCHFVLVMLNGDCSRFVKEVLRENEPLLFACDTRAAASSWSEIVPRAQAE